MQLSKEENKVTIRNSVPIPLGNISAKFTTFYNLADGKEHVLLDFRKENQDQINPIMVRMHSECLTGDIFNSSRCDCGEQLSESVKKLHEAGGILIYLRQEGRGIGLYNKIDAYALQIKGHDTYMANALLGLKDDLRDYKVAAQMLLAVGVNEICLLSNNPLKVSGLKDNGIKVIQRISTGVFLKPGNKSYLKAKVIKTKHEIDFSLALGVS